MTCNYFGVQSVFQIVFANDILLIVVANGAIAGVGRNGSPYVVDP